MILPTLVLDSPHARASLRVEVTQAGVGRPFLAAVEVDMDPHWHVYWRNPGDSGIPTTVAWKAPRGWRVEPLEEPTPTRFAPGGVAAYGYEGRALFLAWVTPSTGPGTLSARVKWLVCANACVPGSASVSAKIVVGGREVPNRDAPTMRAALAALPRRATGWTARAIHEGKAVVLTIDVANRVPKAATAEFFPEESGVIDHAKPAIATLRGGRFVFKMDASPFPEHRDRLKGLLVLSGARRQALSIAPKLENGVQP